MSSLAFLALSFLGIMIGCAFIILSVVIETRGSYSCPTSEDLFQR